MLRLLTSQLIGLAEFAVAVPAKLSGLGSHAFCLDPADLTNALRLWFIAQLLVYPAVFFVKLSITLFLLRIGGLPKLSRVALIVNIVFLGLAKLAFIIELLVLCRPISANWDPRIRTTASCISPDAMVGTSYLSAGLSWLQEIGI